MLPCKRSFVIPLGKSLGLKDNGLYCVTHLNLDGIHLQLSTEIKPVLSQQRENEQVRNNALLVLKNFF